MKEQKKISINFSESRLMDIIDTIIYYDNIFLTTDELDSLIGKIEHYIGNLGIDVEECNKLSDDMQDIANGYAQYAYKEGFKEGVRLFRTMMSL